MTLQRYNIYFNHTTTTCIFGKVLTTHDYSQYVKTATDLSQAGGGVLFTTTEKFISCFFRLTYKHTNLYETI